MDKELKPCPFCGGDGEIRGNMTFVKVVCDSCDCTGPLKFAKEDAIRFWNKRVSS